MDVKDYGLYYSEKYKGTDSPPILLLPHYVFFELSGIEPDLFSSSAQIEINGEPYVLTVDFDRLMFNKLLTCIPEYYADQLREIVDTQTEYPFYMELDQMPIQVELRLRLGELQHDSDGEDFISMIVLDVSPPQN